ncbi:MAG: LysR family transcriptional regulator [Hirschia sp.]|nr:LysR family transcriptional regulator [Hirschia sp.]MBF20027.1 LysR family transcriptional regulator [Hirschia sp.]|tara:strand:- start:1149 stop:2042 length:894 start_codon:yes stop_codon:yes gene_type:complete
MTDTSDLWARIDAFLAVAQAQSFTRAAQALGVSVSNVSRRVSALEDYLGTRLISRTTRRLNLTEAGRLFEQKCRHLQNERDAALESIMSGGDTLRGPIRITCSVAFGERSIVPILNRFALLHPDVTLEINLTNSILDIISEGYDLGVRTGDPSGDRLESKRLGERSLHLCASSDYLGSHPPIERIQDLDQHRCLLGNARDWTFTVNGRQTLFRPNSAWRCNNGFGVLDAALQGLGVCQLPDFYVDQHFGNGRLVELLEEFRPLDQPIWAVYPSSARSRQRVQALVAFLSDEMSASGE